MDSSAYEQYGLTPADGDLALTQQVLLHLDGDVETQEEMLLSLLQIQEICQQKALILNQDLMTKPESVAWAMLGITVSNRLVNFLRETGYNMASNVEREDEELG